MTNSELNTLAAGILKYHFEARHQYLLPDETISAIDTNDFIQTHMDDFKNLVAEWVSNRSY